MTVNQFEGGQFYLPARFLERWGRLYAHTRAAYLTALREHEPQYLLSGLHLCTTLESGVMGDTRGLHVLCGLLSTPQAVLIDLLQQYTEGTAVEVQVRTEHGVIVDFNLARIQ